MDKEFLAKYGLEEAVKRFNQINEYTFITSPMISEDGEDNGQSDDVPQDGNANMPLQQGQQPNDQMAGQNSGDGAMEQQPMNNQMPDMSGGEQGQMPNDGTMPQMPNQDMPPVAGMDNADPMDGGVDGPEGEENDEEVIDVDDLTQSQEASEVKIDGVDDKLTRMMALLSKFTDAIEANDKKIDDLRHEFEERNPSEQEKLNIRSQASYPYSETPKDYWDNKMTNNPHYKVIYDNEVSTADEPKKFEITTDDIKDANYRDIAKSFDINDDISLEDFIDLN